MKRTDLHVNGIYAYSEGRTYSWTRYSPFMVLGRELYKYNRFERTYGPASPGDKMGRRGGVYGSPVGILGVILTSTEPDDVAKVWRLATTEAALEALNGESRALLDPDDHERTLGKYMLLSYLPYLHGNYGEVVAQQAASRKRSQEVAQQQEQDRLARRNTYEALAGRLDALGITGYHSGTHEDVNRFEGLSFDDMDALLSMAEAYKMEIGG